MVVVFFFLRYKEVYFVFSYVGVTLENVLKILFMYLFGKIIDFLSYKNIRVFLFEWVDGNG